MNQLSTISTAITTMTSREISELTGKDISHIHRDIRAMLNELKKDDPNLNHPQEDQDSRGYTTCFYLNRELTETLLTGYSASARLKVIRRWHELESKQAVKHESTGDVSVALLQRGLAVAAMLKVPEHLAQSEAVKEVLLTYGVDFSPYLKLAPAQQGMLTHEEMLEPTELGRIVKMSGAAMNLRLEAADLQTKIEGRWVLTELGEQHATAHHWQTKGCIKSGYNLKWRRSVLKMIDL